MANISNEIRAFQNAVYGEEVRSSMISAIQKINTVTENCESTVDNFSSNISSATTAANTAASNANTAATNANNAATAANTAKNAANTAASNANAAVTSANNAASNATAAATSANNAEAARVTAENARANAESTRQANESARQSAEQARVSAEATRANSESARDSAESARQTNEITRQGNERQRQNSETLRENAESSRASGFSDMQAAFADMQRTVIPQATESTMGGIIVGDGLSVDNALLSLANTKSKSGTAITSNGAALESVVVYGQSIQDGTPTPESPLEVQVVEGRNLLPNISSTNRTHSGVAFSVSENRIAASGTSTALAESNLITLDAPVTLEAGKQYTISLSGKYSVSGSSTLLVFYDESSTAVFNSSSTSNGVWTFTPAATMNLKHMRFRVNTAGATVSVDANIQLEEGPTATPYVPYGSIGIVVGDTATSIDLQDNTLASLPDGTRDELQVDSAGHCVLSKNVGKYTFNGSEDWSLSGGSKRINNNNLRALTRKAPDNYTTIQTVCNRFTPQTASQTYAGTVGVSIDTTGSVGFANGSTIDIDTWKSWLESNNIVLLYPLATPQTIDLGYIDQPAIPEGGATVSVSASITPVIDVSWWENGAAAVASAISKLTNEIKSLKAQIAALATS